MGIICFPSLQSLAEDISNQLAQEIQKALVGKPAGKGALYGEQKSSALSPQDSCKAARRSPLSSGVRVVPSGEPYRLTSVTEDVANKGKGQQRREGGLADPWRPDRVSRRG